MSRYRSRKRRARVSRESFDREELLARNHQRSTAGGEHDDGRARSLERGHELGRGRPDVLTVVEHEQEAPTAEVVDECLVGLPAPAQADRRHDDLAHLRRLGHSGEVRDGDPRVERPG